MGEERFIDTGEVGATLRAFRRYSPFQAPPGAFTKAIKSIESCQAEIDRINFDAEEAYDMLLSQHDRLREIVEKLPKTADKHPAFEGDTVWVVDVNKAYVYKAEQAIVAFHPHLGWVAKYGVVGCVPVPKSFGNKENAKAEASELNDAAKAEGGAR